MIPLFKNLRTNRKRCHRQEEKEAKRIERERKKEEREKKREERQQKAAEKKRGKGQMKERKWVERVRVSSRSHTEAEETTSESEAECPKCGVVYGESDSMWIQCNSCDAWFDMKCADLPGDEIPDEYFCVDCL